MRTLLPRSRPCQTALADIGLQPFAIMGLEQPVQMITRQTGRGGDPVKRQRRIEMRLDIIHRRLDMLLRRLRHPTGPPARRHKPGLPVWQTAGPGSATSKTVWSSFGGTGPMRRPRFFVVAFSNREAGAHFR